MKMAALLLFSLAASELLARAGEPVVLAGPADATKAELDQCATALAKRLAAFGLKGFKVKAVEKDGTRTVEVSSSAEIEPGDCARIEKLAGRAGRKPMLRFRRELTSEEVAQGYTPGKVGDDLAGAKAPPGTFWALALDKDMKPVSDMALLMLDSPAHSWSEVSVQSRNDKEWTFKLSPAATRQLQVHFTKGDPKLFVPSTVVRVSFDNLVTMDYVDVTLGEDKKPFKEGIFKLPASLAEYLEPILRFPMPRALSRAPAK